MKLQKRYVDWHLTASLVLLSTCCQLNAAEPTTKLPDREHFHLYLLIGQSNMAGRGSIEEEDKVAHPRVLTFSKDNAWVPAIDPLHFDKPAIAGVGLGSTFGRVMADANPNVTIGLIPCAVGGTPLSRWQKDGDLYQQAIKRTKTAMKDGTLKGVLWHQGESDAGSEETARSYGKRLAQMISDLRKELNAGELPFVAGQLGEFLRRESKDGKPSYWPLINEQLASLPSRADGTAVVSASALKHKGDEVHFDAPSLRELGKRYAKAMQELQKSKKHPAAAAKPPNVLIILADDLGYSDLGCYGGEIETPNLDGLASRGLRFTQFYNTARCWPTRAALLTGYYAQQVRRDTLPGIPSGGRGVRPAWARLLPEMLQPLGYRAYHSGKWHIDGKPLENGFDRSYLLQDQGRFFSPQLHFEDDVQLPPVERSAGYYATTAIADHAVTCLREHAQHHSDQPFYQFVAFTAPHFPLHALEQDIAKYRDRYRQGWEFVREARWKRIQSLGLVRGELSPVEPHVGPPYHFPAALKTLGPREVNRPLPWRELNEQQREFQASKMAIHAAMIDRMDQEIGKILQQLRAMDAQQNTLLFFLSDNGASAEIMVRDDGHDPAAAPGSAESYLCLGPGWSSVANTPLRRHKTWVHEGGIATPLIVHWPAGISARGELRHNVGHVIDLVPTILDVASGKPLVTSDSQPPLPGTSLVAAFDRDGSVAREFLWWSHEGNRALRAGDWKLVAAGADASWELYDLSADRTETKNHAARMPEKVREMAALWTRQQERFLDLARRDLAPAP